MLAFPDQRTGTKDVSGQMGRRRRISSDQMATRSSCHLIQGIPMKRITGKPWASKCLHRNPRRPPRVNRRRPPQSSPGRAASEWQLATRNSRRPRILVVMTSRLLLRGNRSAASLQSRVIMRSIRLPLPLSTRKPHHATGETLRESVFGELCHAGLLVLLYSSLSSWAWLSVP